MMEMEDDEDDEAPRFNVELSYIQVGYIQLVSHLYSLSLSLSPVFHMR